MGNHSSLCAETFQVGQVWRDETPGSAPKTWTVTRVGKVKVHLRAEYPEFTADATAWIKRILASPYWRRVDA